MALTWDDSYYVRIIAALATGEHRAALTLYESLVHEELNAVTSGHTSSKDLEWFRRELLDSRAAIVAEFTRGGE